MPARVRKAVFPVAGLGTRFLPATKAMPKEMLTVVDRPLIQHVVDEARAAGIEHFIFVTGRNKGVIEDHFDQQPELEGTLAARGKTAELEALAADLPEAGCASFVRQQAPLGLGHAVWCAREIVGDEPFAVLLPDVLVQTPGKGCLAQMLDVYGKRGGNILAVEPVPDDQVKNYGVVAVGEADGNVFPVTGMVEKPAPGTAPSNLTILGRYILQPEIFDLLASQEKGAGGEIQLTDSMLALLKKEPFYAVEYEPFAVLLPDVLVQTAGKGCLAQMLDVYGKRGGNILAVEPVPDDQVKSYGVVAVGEADGNVFPVTGMVEKPAPGTAPSNLTILGRYILQPEIFGLLSSQEKGAGGEIQLTDSMLALLKKEPFYAVEYEGRTFDCGSKPGFLAANLAYALERPELRDAVLAEIKKLI